jgi:hypothetical protein
VTRETPLRAPAIGVSACLVQRNFERRKVSTGTCGRAFGQRDIRCPMLWPDPAQRDRLAEIRDNLTARIAEAEREGWLGEIEGLQVSLTGAKDKLAKSTGAASPAQPSTSASPPSPPHPDHRAAQ